MASVRVTAARSVVLMGALASVTQVRALDGDALFDMSLEELINIEVTTASGKAERLSDTAAAVFVITSEDIRRLGLRSIPEALRLAPGLSVQQIDASTWSVGSRGFSGRYSNKLLVLQDGRPVYSPIFSGVEWEAQTTLMDQIDRIEVVRGPGAAVWGTNAVSGVINIITRRADQGPSRSASVGSDLAGGQHFDLQMHEPVGERSHARAFVMFENPRATYVPGPGNSEDDWAFGRAGLRLDSDLDRTRTSLVVEAFGGRIGRNRIAGVPDALDDADDYAGGFVLGRAQHVHDSGAETKAQISVDYSHRRTLVYEEDRVTIDLDARHQWNMGRHEIVAGGLLRDIDYELTGSVFALLPEEDARARVVSVFAQDEISLVPDVLSVDLGLRLEVNELSDADVEWMPSARMLWRPHVDHSVWAAVTRAVRTPSVGESSLSNGQVIDVVPPDFARSPFPIPTRVALNANENLRSENLMSYEAGVRGNLDGRLSYAVTLFAMRYDDLRSVAPESNVCLPSGIAVEVDPSCIATSTEIRSNLRLTNFARADIDGVEVALDWQVDEHLLMRGSWSLLERELGAERPAQEGEVLAPRQLASLRAEWTPSDRIDASFWLRYVGPSRDSIDSDTVQGHVSVNWRPTSALQVSLTGRNLFHANRNETRSELQDLARTEISRTVYLQARLDF